MPDYEVTAVEEVGGEIRISLRFIGQIRCPHCGERKRTDSQNRYYFGVVCKLVSEHTGHDVEQVHELFKQMFSPKWHLIGLTGDVAIPTSTTRLDTLAFSDYVERCRLWANEFLGLQIPLPGEITV